MDRIASDWYAKVFHRSTSKYGVPGVVDVGVPSFWVAAAAIIFNPLFWNLVAQNEYRNKTITHALGGRRYLGCYLLAATIFTLGIVRDTLFERALSVQPTSTVLLYPAVKVVAALLFAAGMVFVLSSMWALGITGTFLGDYFGILMDHKVTSFPFNVIADPMYWGSAANFVAVSLWYGKPAGLLLSVLVVVVYKVALVFEGPFTEMIYREASKKKPRTRSSPAKAAGARSTPSKSTPSRAKSTPSKSTPARSTPARSTPARSTPVATDGPASHTRAQSRRRRN